MQISVARPPEFNYFKPVEVKNLTEMAELCLKNNFSPAIFKNGKRNLDSFEIAYCIGLDIDNDGKLKPGGKVSTPIMSIDDAKEAFKDYTHLILPSRSHQKDKPGEGIQDRFRVILFFSEPITDLDTFYSTWHWCEAKWPAIDHQCKDPSRGYYAHSAIESVRGGGLRVTPVPPPPKEEKKIVDRSTLSISDRGKLSRATLEFLVAGTGQGNRNGETYKAAKDFQQNLYNLEETEDKIIAALNANGTVSSDFPEDEARNTIHSAFNRDPKHEPRIKPRAFNMVQIGSHYESVGNNTEPDWLCDGLLQTAGVSLLAAEPKTGKSELARQLSVNVIQGSDFLGRKCRQGTVYYFGVEESVKILVRSFKKKGVLANAPLYVHVGDPVDDSDVFENFKELIMANRPALAVVDTAFDIIDVQSEKDLMPIKKAFRKMRKIARESGTHILLIHHAGKPQNGIYRSANHSVLGSTGITAGVDNIIVMQLRGTVRLISTSGRDVTQWHNRRLIWDDKDKTYSLGPEEQDDF